MPDVQAAQEYYRDVFGCTIQWITDDKHIGAVSKGESALFFRKAGGRFEPVVMWVFVESVDETFKTLKEAGAVILEPIENKPWGLRQFTVSDLAGHLYYFHHDYK